ncbi:Coatomer subunit delta [Portunus trituberculatus]|uniref:Coatomer subunit delta n=1 Tax=Portunus trituberculatus TaxID=210409 RepID=A0A5B7CW39_PORTR|nr:Coatomer subunit delta [Portunus trituberculatus]
MSVYKAIAVLPDRRVDTSAGRARRLTGRHHHTPSTTHHTGILLSRCNLQDGNSFSGLSVHIVVAEDLVVHAGRDGGLKTMEIQGILKLRISDPDYGYIKVQVDNTDSRPIQLQTHPNVDRELWRSCGQIGMKMSNKPFPHNTDVGVLKWRFQTNEEKHVPLSINCWPQENGAGSCDVNIEYNLENLEMELSEVVITIPLAPGAPPPVINECEGEHEYSRAHCALVWRIPVIDKTAPTAAMDFTARGVPDNFFPVRVSFNSTRMFCDIKGYLVILHSFRNLCGD